MCTPVGHDDEPMCSGLDRDSDIGLADGTNVEKTTDDFTDGLQLQAQFSGSKRLEAEYCQETWTWSPFIHNDNKRASLFT